MTSELIQKYTPYRHWEYLDHQTQDRLRIVPERGGLITEWKCNGTEILYFDLERFQLKNKSIRGGIPILFPICGDLPNNVLTLSQGDFFINQHGFARNMPWEIKDLGNSLGISLSLSSSPETFRFFPFPFAIQMAIKLERNCLDIKILIKNLGKEDMPFSFGLHPYFKVQDLENISIQGLPENCINHLNMKKTSTKSQLDKISKGIDFLTDPRGSVSLLDLSTMRSIEMQTKFPMDLAVLWTDPPRDMVCLEPWTSPRNSLINGNRKILIGSGESEELFCRFVSN